MSQQVLDRDLAKNFTKSLKIRKDEKIVKSDQQISLQFDDFFEKNISKFSERWLLSKTCLDTRYFLFLSFMNILHHQSIFYLTKIHVPKDVKLAVYNHQYSIPIKFISLCFTLNCKSLLTMNLLKKRMNIITHLNRP